MDRKKYVVESAFKNMDVQKIMQLGVDANGRIVHWTDSIGNIEELNSDYINEHYGSLQDEAYQAGLNDGSLDVKQRVEGAYQKGFEDGKKSTEKGCEGCKYEECGDTEDPCWHCRKSYKDKYEPAPHSDRIEVGDIVEVYGNIGIVTYAYENTFDVMMYDGSAGGWDREDLKKTGKHYDIKSILEAMKNG